WPVSLSSVQSVYLFKIPYVGFLLNFIQTKTGWFLAIIVPAALLVGWLIKDILKEAFRDVDKTTDKKRGEAYLEGTMKNSVKTMAGENNLNKKRDEAYLRNMANLRNALRETLSEVGNTSIRK
ncbi:MAG: hypothetical protein ABIH70_06670, partial [Chloroflexota bacterium]